MNNDNIINKTIIILALILAVNFLTVTQIQAKDEPIAVTFVTNPPGAMVLLNGVELGATDGSGRLGRFLMPGIYELIVQKNGYIADQREIRIEDGGDSGSSVAIGGYLIEINLVRNWGILRLNVEPKDVVVRINGEVQEIEEASELVPGDYDIEVTKSGYLPYRAKVEVKPGGTITRDVELLRNSGTLRLSVEPEDALVRIDREVLEVRDARAIIDLSPGVHHLEVKRESYAPYIETIKVGLGDKIERLVELEPYEGVLQLTVRPYESSWTLRRVEEGRSVGFVAEGNEGLARIRGLLEGEYILEVSSSDFLLLEERVVIRRDEITEMNVVLMDRTTWERDKKTTVVNVTNPATGMTWMDRNLGASRVATSSTDSEAYGDLYQWGRAADGHQKRASGTRTTLSSSDQPGHSDFIFAMISPYDWRFPQNENLWHGMEGVNNPCPVRYRLPTEAEWETERKSWISNNSPGAYGSPLKLPVAGYRSSMEDMQLNVGSNGRYWSSSVDDKNARYLIFSSGGAVMLSGSRAYGRSVRCLKD